MADVQMLLHVTADRKEASVVSIPRDTRVMIPECENSDSGKKSPAVNTLINESLSLGGPGCTLDTWEKLTGIYIDHWMMVDFAGVVAMADAVGGAEVCVKHDVYDFPKPSVPGGSYLELKKGTTQVQGKKALQWLRTRHAFGSDFGRSKAQHMYMNSVIRRLKSQNAFTDTGQLMNLAETASTSLQVSEGLGTVKNLFDVGMQLKDIPMDRINMLTMPRIPDPRNKNHVLPKPGAADKLWSLLREDQPLDSKDRDTAAEKPRNQRDQSLPDPTDRKSLTFTIVNGTGGDGTAATPRRAAAIAAVLQAQGFEKASASPTAGSTLTTELAYPKDSGVQGKADAKFIARSIGVPDTAVKASGEVEHPTLTIGSDWRVGNSYPETAPDDSDLISDAEAVNGADGDACMDVYWPYRTP
ncbi:LCP family protein [Streptomyces sindenensis]|uniref:LCP family protein n=1 Tax=Streptomyces sindenensis TaxID=67363 RepID=UPI001E297885|nr:LCP family protein [Streptomyces sindenensis]